MCTKNKKIFASSISQLSDEIAGCVVATKLQKTGYFCNLKQKNTIPIRAMLTLCLFYENMSTGESEG